MLRRHAIPLALVMALWPMWRWMASRTMDLSDDSWELLSLATAVMFIVVARRNQESGASPVALIGLLLVYALAYHILPPLLRGCIGMTALAIACSGAYLQQRINVALLGLLLLSLPLIASLNFYLGYPLRVVVGEAAQVLLQMNGFEVVREGASLDWGGRVVSIDAPCSGIKMLWAGLYLSCTLAAFLRLTAWRTVLLGASAVAVVLAGNVLRAVSLFHLEVGGMGVSELQHAVIGIVVFVLAAVGIGGVARRFQAAGMLGFEDSAQPTRGWEVMACVLVGVVPLWSMPAAPREDAGFPGWPEQYEGRKLQALPLTALEQRFAADFPGRIARFSDGEREIVMRWVTRDTRQLHPAADCFRGSGYTVKPQALEVDARGARWGSFSATRGNERLRVLERIHDAHGNQWSDVSSWYWAALRGQSAGPWWAVTLAETLR